MDDDGARLDRLEQQMGDWDRKAFHDLRKSVDAAGLEIRLIRDRQTYVVDSQGRVEGHMKDLVDLLREQNGRVRAVEIACAKNDGVGETVKAQGLQLTRLDERSANANRTATQLGAAAGTFTAGLLMWLLRYVGAAK